MEFPSVFERHPFAAVIVSVVFLGALGATGYFFVQGSYVGDSQVTYDSNSPFFDGEVLQADYVADSSTDKINAYWTEDELQSKTGEYIQDSVSIEVEKTDTSAEYRFQDGDYRPISYVEAVESPAQTWEEDAVEWGRNNCFDISGDGSSNRGSDYVIGSGFFGNYFVYCTQEYSRLGSVGDIATPQPQFSTTWSVQAGSKEPQECTVSNNEVGSGKQTRCTDNVLIKWSGTNSLRNAPVADDELILHDNDLADGFRVIEEERYGNWRQEMESSNGLIDELEQLRDGEISPTDVNDINNQASEAYKEYSSSPLADARFSGTSINAGSMTLDTSYELLWPEFTVYIDGADYITVEKPVGEPRIQSTSSTDINEIGGGSVSMTVENVGDYEGSFSGRVKSCSPEFEPTDTVKTQTVASGDSTVFEFMVSFSSQSNTREVSGDCTLEVENSDSSVVKTSTVGLTGIQESECTPGDSLRAVVDGNQAIQECGSDGLPGDIIEVCDDGEQVENVEGQLQCTSTGPGGGGGGGGTGTECEPLFDAGGLLANFQVKDPFCGEGLLGKISTTIHLGLATVIALLSGRLVYRWSRWIDGENQIRGRFKVQDRSVSRVAKGRLSVGLLGGAAALLVAAWVGLQLSIGLQLVAVIGLFFASDREKAKRTGRRAGRGAVKSVKKGAGRVSNRERPR